MGLVEGTQFAPCEHRCFSKLMRINVGGCGSRLVIGVACQERGDRRRRDVMMPMWRLNALGGQASFVPVL